MTTLSISQTSQRNLVLSAWAILLATSTLPNILWTELVGGTTTWLLWIKVILLGSLIAGSFALPALRSLRAFCIVILAIYLAEHAAFRLSSTTLWQSWFAGMPFTIDMLGIQLRRVAVSLVMIAVLLGQGFKREQFFLRLGDLRAPFQPVRWLGFSKPEPWTHYGWRFVVFISLGLLVFLVIGGRPGPDFFRMALPFLPAVLGLAAMNAWGEEVTYRAALLAPLEGVVGPRQALYLTAAFFGLAHFYGVPYGVVGVIMSAFLGWLLGKAMLETRGLFWAWLIHFFQDILIFTFMAVGSIIPGG
jgi:membrane protease YdiL (CAAX protease family)